jgi:hypothetical protein
MRSVELGVPKQIRESFRWVRESSPNDRTGAKEVRAKLEAMNRAKRTNPSVPPVDHEMGNRPYAVAIFVVSVNSAIMLFMTPTFPFSALI